MSHPIHPIRVEVVSDDLDLVMLSRNTAGEDCFTVVQPHELIILLAMRYRRRQCLEG